jgi:hypothetical protein
LPALRYAAPDDKDIDGPSWHAPGPPETKLQYRYFVGPKARIQAALAFLQKRPNNKKDDPAAASTEVKLDQDDARSHAANTRTPLQIRIQNP